MWQIWAAYYLLNAKSGNGMPFDPVARFHLGNGAEILAVHSEADNSARGQEQSFGAMVNYIYDPTTVAKNHEKFANTKVVLAAKSVAQAADEAWDLLMEKS